MTPQQQIAHYRITAKLGEGGMGEVWRATDTKLNREVAIKILPDEFAQDPGRMARFQREAQVLASLNHPHIASVYGLEERALVMELVEGETLPCPLPVDTALQYAKQIAEALEYAHEHGVIHRDLKPANIKVTSEGVVKLLDFGLAKAIEEHDGDAGDPSVSPTLTLGHTQVGVILGTAAYMAPEQAAGAKVDRRADIWSFGAVLFEVLSGRRAFPGDSVADTLARVMKVEPDWNALPSDTPPAIRKLIQRCLTKDRKQRLQAIGEARILLENPRAEVTAFARPRLRRLGWVAAGIFALSTAVLAWALWRTSPGGDPGSMTFQIPVPENEHAGVFVLSPNGGRMVFWSVGSDGVARLWVRGLGSLQARPLSGTEAGRSLAGPPPFWSPDSRFVAFYADGKLKKIDVAGGPPQTVCNVPGSSPAVGGSWNADGVILFGTVGPVMRVSASGGTPTPVTRVDPARAENRHLTPIFLPDGRHFVYLRISNSVENSGLYLGSLDDPPAKQNLRLLASTSFGPVYVPSPHSRFGHLLFLRDGILMAQTFNEGRFELTGEPAVLAEQVGSVLNGGYFSASSNGLLAYRAGGVTYRYSQLTWLDGQGKETRRLWEPGAYFNPAVAPDGSRVAVSRFGFQSGGRDLWIIDSVRDTAARFTFTSGVNSPVWSPDGRSIAFRSTRDGAYDLFLKEADNAINERPLLKSDANKMPTSWSHDGRWLLYTVVDRKTKGDIWVVPVASGTKDERKPVPLSPPFLEISHFPRSEEEENSRTYISSRPDSSLTYATQRPSGENWASPSLNSG